MKKYFVKVAMQIKEFRQTQMAEQITTRHLHFAFENDVKNAEKMGEFNFRFSKFIVNWLKNLKFRAR